MFLHVQEHFQKYYDAVMPYLKAILVNASDKSNRMLRAKSMECISLVGMAVGKDKFKEDAKQVIFYNVYPSFYYSMWTCVIFSECCLLFCLLSFKSSNCFDNLSADTNSCHSLVPIMD